MGAERRYTDADVRADEELIELAHEYAEAYQGEFEPLVHARMALESGRILTTVEVRKVLNCMRNDWNYADKMPEPQAQIIQMPERKERKTMPKSIRNEAEPFEKQCDETISHEAHPHAKKNGRGGQHWCEGVAFPINRNQLHMRAYINEPFIAARGGKLIHVVRQPAVTIWTPRRNKRHEEGWVHGVHLKALTVCKYPGIIRAPRVFSIDTVTMILAQDVMELSFCRHCMAEIEAEVDGRGITQGQGS